MTYSTEMPTVEGPTQWEIEECVDEMLSNPNWWQEVFDGHNNISDCDAAIEIARAMQYLGSAFRDLENLPIIKAGSICVVLQALKQLQTFAKSEATKQAGHRHSTAQNVERASREGRGEMTFPAWLSPANLPTGTARLVRKADVYPRPLKTPEHVRAQKLARYHASKNQPSGAAR